MLQLLKRVNGHGFSFSGSSNSLSESLQLSDKLNSIESFLDGCAMQLFFFYKARIGGSESTREIRINL